MKTISMRLRAATIEMQNAGEDTDGMATSVANLRGQIKALTKSTGRPVDIMLNEDTFKSTYDIMKGLSDAWNSGKMSDINKASLLELIAGKTQSNIAAAMLQNFDQAENALGTSRDSAGSALHENQAVLDSIQGKMTRLDASFQSLSGILVNSDLMKAGLDVANFGMSGITSLSRLASNTPIASLVGLGTAISSIWGVINGTRMGTFTRNDHFDPNKGVFGNVMFRGQDIASLVKSGSVDQSRKGVFDKAWTSVKNRFNTDKIAVAEYNKALKDGTLKIDDYVGAQSKLNDAQQDYISTLDGTKASYVGYKKYLSDRVNGFDSEASRMRRATRIAEQYNEAQAKGKDEALAFATAQKEKTRAVGDFLEGYAKDNKSLKMGESSKDVNKLADNLRGQMAPSGSIIPAGLKSIGATFMSGLMNVGLNMAISAVADGVLKLGNYVANINQRKYEKAVETYQERKSDSTEQRKNYDALSGYAKQYEALVNSGSVTGTERTSQIKELQSEINALLLESGQSINLLNANWSNNIAQLKEAVSLQRELTTASQKNTTQAAEDVAKSQMRLLSHGDLSGLWNKSARAQAFAFTEEIQDAFKKNGIKYNKRSEYAINTKATLDFSGKEDIAEIVKYQNAYSEALENMRLHGKQGTEAYAENLQMYNKIAGILAPVQEEYQKQADLMADTAFEAKSLNGELSDGSDLYKQLSNIDDDKILPSHKKIHDTADAFGVYKNALYETLKQDQEFMDFAKKSGYNDDKIKEVAEEKAREYNPIAAELYDRQQEEADRKRRGERTSQEYRDLAEADEAIAEVEAKNGYKDRSEKWRERAYNDWLNSFVDQSKAADKTVKDLFSNAYGKNADAEINKAIKSAEKLYSQTGKINEAGLKNLCKDTQAFNNLLDQCNGNYALAAKLLDNFIGSNMKYTGATEHMFALYDEMGKADNVFSQVDFATAKYQKAIEGPENDDNFKIFASARDLFNEEAEKGRLGSRKIRAAEELIFGRTAMEEADYDVAKMIANAHSGVDRILKNKDDSGLQYLKEFADYYKDGNVYATDKQTGKADMSKILGTIKQNAEGKWEINIKDLEKFAKEQGHDWGVSSDFSLANLQAIRNYFPDASFIDGERAAKALHDTPALAKQTLADGRKVYNRNDLENTIWDMGGSYGDINTAIESMKAQGDVVIDLTGDINDLANALTEIGAITKGKDGEFLPAKDFDAKVEGLGLTTAELVKLKMALDEVYGKDWELKVKGTDEVEDASKNIQSYNERSKESKPISNAVSRQINKNPAMADGLDQVPRIAAETEARSAQVKRTEDQYRKAGWDDAAFDGFKQGANYIENATQKLENFNRAKEKSSINGGMPGLPVKAAEYSNEEAMNALNQSKQTKKTVKVEADTTEANAKIDETNSKAETMKNGQVTVDANTEQAKANLDETEQKADSLNNKNPNVNVTASGETSALDEANEKANALDGKTVKVNVDTETKSPADLLAQFRDLDAESSANVKIEIDAGAIATVTSQIEALKESISSITAPDLSSFAGSFASVSGAMGPVVAAMSQISAAVSKVNSASLGNLVGSINNIVGACARATAGFATTQGAANSLNNVSLGSVIGQISSVSSTASSAAGQVRAISAALDALNGKNVTTTVTTRHVTVGGSSDHASVGRFSGTATGGTIGSLAKGSNFAQGGMTLVGELGPEMVRSGDKSYMVGRFGPELVRLKKGDQVFNHIETRRILATGGLNSPKAVLPAHANGTNGAYRFPAMASMKTPEGGSGITYIPLGLGSGQAAANANQATAAANNAGKAIQNTAKQTATAVQNTAKQTATAVQNAAALSKDAWEEELAKHKWMVATKQETDQQYFDWYSKQINIQKEGGIVTQKDWYGLDTERYNLEINLIKQQFDLEQAKKDYALEYADINKAQYAKWYEGFENRKNDAGLYTELEWAQAQIKILQQSREIWNQKISDFDHATNMAQYDVYDKIARLKDKHQWMTDNIKQFWKDGKLSAEQYHSALEQIEELTQTIKNEEFSAWESWMGRRDTRYNHLVDSDLVGGLSRWYTEICESIRQGRAELEKLILEGAGWDDPRVEKIMEMNRKYDQERHQKELQTTKDAKAALKNLFSYYKSMRQQDINDQKETLQKQYNEFKKNLDNQKRLLKRQKEDEDYLYNQAKKRKSVSDIQMQLQQLSMDSSAQAGKKRVELMQQLYDAQDNLDQFEKDRAYNLAVRFLDDEEKAYADAYEKKTDELNHALDNMGKLYDEFLEEMRVHSNKLFEEFKEWNYEHGTGIRDDIVSAWDEAYSSLKDYEALYHEFLEGINTNSDGMNNSQGGDKDLTGWEVEKNPWVSNTQANTQLKNDLNTKFEQQEKERLEREAAEKAKKEAEAAAAAAAANKNGTNVKPATETKKEPVVQKPELKVGSKVKLKPGTKWYGSSSGQGGYGSTDKEIDAVINIISSASWSTHPYSVNGWGWVRKEDIVGYASGTSSAKSGLARIDEVGSETIFESKNGHKYKMFSGGEKVLNAKASNFLFDFANQGSTMFAGFFKSLGEGLKAVVNSTSSPINVSMGDIIVHGSADKATVSEIRRAQRDNLDYMLRNLGKLQATT